MRQDSLFCTSTNHRIRSVGKVSGFARMTAYILLNTDLYSDILIFSKYIFNGQVGSTRTLARAQGERVRTPNWLAVLPERY